MIIKTENLSGAALDWAVAQCINDESIVYHEGRPAYEQEFDPCNWQHYEDMKRFVTGRYFQPSTDWDQGGPLIDRYEITFMRGVESSDQKYFAIMNVKSRTGLGMQTAEGPTHLIAAMRAFVASELGVEVDVPEELEL